MAPPVIPTEIQKVIDEINTVKVDCLGVSVDDIKKLTPKTAVQLCAEQCYEVCKAHNEECDLLRKRITELLNEKGCSATVRATKTRRCRKPSDYWGKEEAGNGDEDDQFEDAEEGGQEVLAPWDQPANAG